MANTNLPRGTILMAGTSQIEDWFNMNGVGIGEYKGWYIFDGRNGTPDLRKRFLVGRDSSHGDYSNIGLKGGSEKVQLAINDLSNHSHSIDVKTSTTPSHDHFYNDVTYADGCDFPVPMYRGIRSDTAHNRACQIGRRTDPAGDHSHTVSGMTSAVGSNSPIENRPPYYVVSYIIYIGY